jgi:hypothetical protein
LGRNRGEDIDAWKDLQALRVWDAVDELRRHGASDRAGGRAIARRFEGNDVLSIDVQIEIVLAGLALLFDNQ